MRLIFTAAHAALLLTACGGSLTPSSDGTTLVPSTVSGQVVSESGAPVPGALVQIWPVSYSGLIEARTDAEGQYRSVELNLAVAPYEARAYRQVTYHGRTYCVRLAPKTAADADVFNPKHGTVRNWQWRLSGPTGEIADSIGSESWGGSVGLYNLVNATEEQFVDWDTPVEVTFVPVGPLIDGSTGTTVVRSGTMSDAFGDVPVGRYEVSVAVVNSDGTRTPLKVSLTDTDELTSVSATLLFDGFETCGHSGTFVRTGLWVSR